MLSSPIAILALKFLFLALAFATGARLVAQAVGRFESARGCAGSDEVGSDQAGANQADHLEAGSILAGAVLGALAGAKLVFAASYPDLWAGAQRHGLWFLAAGFSVPGALAGLWLGLVYAARQRAGAWADALTPAVIAMLLIVDAGATLWSLSEPGYGAAASRWGINFGDGLRRHPVMLYDALLLALMLWANRALQQQGWSMPGLRAGVLWGSYFGTTLLLAFFKPPFGPATLLEKIQLPPYLYAPGLTAEQWLCVIVSAALALASLHSAWRGPDRA